MDTAQQSQEAGLKVDSGKVAVAAEHSVSRLSLEVAGEVLLLLFVGAFFIYMFVDSWNWPFAAALMPRIAVIAGTPFWLVRVVALLRNSKTTKAEHSGIMDTGFIVGADPKAEARRFIRIFGFTALLYGGIWFFGVHFTLPSMLFLYLLIYGRAGWFRSAIIALMFLALIIGFYDRVLYIIWPEPLIASLFGLI